MLERPMTVRLTGRDQDIVEDCYRQTVLSFAQMRDRHFPGKAITTISNRLGQLCRGGFLRRTRVTLPRYDGSGGVGIVYQVTRPGLEYLARLHPNEVISKQLLPLNLNQLGHDLLLNDTMKVLKKRFPGQRMVHGAHFQRSHPGGKRYPDAVLVGHSGVSQIAVELELTAKSENRYRAIVLEYQIHSRFSKVLYVVSGSTIQEKIQYQITQAKNLPGLGPSPTGKFYFTTLRDLLANPMQTPITNGRDSLVIA